MLEVESVATVTIVAFSVIADAIRLELLTDEATLASVDTVESISLLVEALGVTVTTVGAEALTEELEVTVAAGAIVATVETELELVVASVTVAATVAISATAELALVALTPVTPTEVVVSTELLTARAMLVSLTTETVVEALALALVAREASEDIAAVTGTFVDTPLDRVALELTEALVAMDA